jgi:hypothetical protein
MHLCRMFQKRPPTFNPCFGWPSGWFSQPLDPQHGRVPSSAAVANEESRWAPAVLADPLGNTWIAGLEPSLCGQLGMAPKTHPLRRPTWVVEFWGVNHLKLFPCESSTVFWSTVSSCIFIYLDLHLQTILIYLHLISSSIKVWLWVKTLVLEWRHAHHFPRNGQRFLYFIPPQFPKMVLMHHVPWSMVI